ncbi:MAG: nucleotidyltransferase family protein [Lachnospiraceae bacterium]|nr:nucleotidyltransferase family protein [Lachnospiraceae bacterium]
MKVIGIIAEFNPFHNGHEYIIRTAKEKSGADFCVIVMSGDFVQRGEPAICDKYLRTRMALMCGADAVFELPSVFARASAEKFAYGGVSVLSYLGCVDEFYFGTESEDAGLIMKGAEILANEPAEYKTILSNLLKSGLSFPVSREAALKKYLENEPDISDFSENGSVENNALLLNSIKQGLLSSPNNILGIEYCKAVLRLKASGIKVPEPVTIKRKGSSYDSSVPDTVRDASALALRNFIKNGSIDRIRSYMPASSYDILCREYRKTMPLFSDDFSSMLYSSLTIIKSLFNISSISDSQYSQIRSEIPSDLLNAIMKKTDRPISFTGLIEELKTKNVTYSAVSRALLSLLLDTADIVSEKVKSDPAVSLEVTSPKPLSYAGLPYARLLGMKKDSSALVRKINETAACEIINKLADAKVKSPMLEADIRAAVLYGQIVYQKFGTRLSDEYRKTIEII